MNSHSAPKEEPSVCRWPHPVEAAPDSSDQAALLRYFHCSLAYQNQTLSEIKTLLEQLCLAVESLGSHEKNSG